MITAITEISVINGCNHCDNVVSVYDHCDYYDHAIIVINQCDHSTTAINFINFVMYDRKCNTLQTFTIP